MKQSEDHMDDLFRKAGENYPLKTDGADWDKVMARLQSGPDRAPVPLAEAGDKRDGRKLWWLLLLLLLFPVGWLLYHDAGTGRHGMTASSAQATASSSTAPAQSAATSPAASTAPAIAAPAAATAPAATAPATITAPFATAPAIRVPATTTPFANARNANAPHVTLLAANAVPRNIITRSPGANRAANNNAEGAAGNEPAGAPATNTTATNTTATNPPGTNAPGTTASGTNAAATSATTTPQSASNPAATTTQTLASTAKPAPSKGSRHPTSAKAQRGFYAGVVGGPDISTIKWQQIQDPGFSVGLTLGYRFNRSLSVEAGALWDHKVYYTDGEYFNRAKTDIPANLTITSMNGNCSMIELPVDLRWDFAQFRHGGGLFATAGFSSYLMKKESYSYDGNWGISYPNMEGYKTYNNSGNDFLAIFQLSAGYSFKWDHIGNVRIEPYWKIPLKGVGIGSLPMTSTGLYIGITRPFR